jgi:hypothetical protein
LNFSNVISVFIVFSIEEISISLIFLIFSSPFSKLILKSSNNHLVSISCNNCAKTSGFIILSLKFIQNSSGIFTLFQSASKYFGKNLCLAKS